MKDLRSEIRAAFDKEQATHPPSSRLRRQVVAAVADGRGPSSSFQWVAVAAAVLLGILVVGGLMSTRFAHRQPVPAKASPISDYGSPPVGVPLLYMVDPRNWAWLQGFDWQGKPRATVKSADIDDARGHRIEMAPDGSAFMLDRNSQVPSLVLDRLGNSIQMEQGDIWADDNTTICSMQLDKQNPVWTLRTQAPGHAVRTVAVIARDSGIGLQGLSVVACSVHRDQAVLVHVNLSWASEVWVVRLSDGNVLSHHFYADDGHAEVIASPDGAYIAESSAKSFSAAATAGADSTIIRRVSDWKVLFSLSSSAQIKAFSGDGSRVLISSSPTPSLLAAHLEIIDWQSRKRLWSYDGPEALGSFTAQPGGPAFAVALKTPPQTIPSPCVESCQVFDETLRDVLIVNSAGSTTQIGGRFIPAW